MNTSRKEFLGALSLATAFAGCTTAGVKGGAGAPDIRPTRFPPITFDGLEPKPDFWQVRPSEIMALCERATKCSKKEVICHTPLGYPVWALFYGDFSEPAPQTNCSAGNGSTTYHNYYGNRTDGKQTFLFIAGIHGAEPECVAGAMNFIQLMETGRDFRGKADPKLLELASKYRVIVVPCVNMDGRAISPDHLRGLDWINFRRASQGYWKDGSLVGWRGSKAWFPLPLDKVGYPGGYPNSEGYNIMHDACPGDLRTEEAKALLKLAARWRVDAVLNGHSYESAPSVIRGTSIAVPENVQRSKEIRYECNCALHEAGILPQPTPTPDKDKYSPGININNLLALASGALTLTLENTVSYDRPDKPSANIRPTRKYEFTELVDVTMIVLKAYLANGLKRPFVYRGSEKVYGD